MFTAVDSPYLVPFDGDFRVSSLSTTPPGKSSDKGKNRRHLEKLVSRADELQRMFYAHDRHAILLVFQGMDAAGKDGTIRSVLSGINPAGCQVFSFKEPTPLELDHDFLWRTSQCLPERGRIGVFNRSYYEDVLIVRVHPDYLSNSKLPGDMITDDIWPARYESIRQHERHLARNGTVVLKFWLNVSKEQQCKRFLKRLNEPEKHWKFSTGDLKERRYWNDYMQAFETALAETSRSWAPWYAIPADNKSYMRVCVADILVRTLESLDMHYPLVTQKETENFENLRQQLFNEK